MSFLHRNLRFSWRLFTSYIKKNWRLFLLGLGVGIIFIYFSPVIFKSFAGKRDRVIGMVGNYTVTTMPISIQKEISIGLTQISSSGLATTAAALRFEATDSGKIVRFYLDKNLLWHDGTKFSSQDINYNLKGVTISKIGNSEVEFKLSEPFAPLSSIVSQPLFKNGLTGLGQWRVTGIKFNGRFIGSIALFDSLTGANKVYKFFPTDEAVMTALKLGVVNEIEEAKSTFGLDKDIHYEITPVDSESKMAVMFFNMRGKIGEEKTVRQGLVYALPNAYDFGKKADSPIALTNWAYNVGVKDYSQNLESAKKMTGATASRSGQLKMLLAVDRNMVEAGKVVEKSWKDIGVNVQTYVTDVVPTSFDAYLTVVDVPSDPDQYFRWHSTQDKNISGYRSPKVDRLLEDGRRTLDLTARKDIYFNFQKAITEDVPAAFLFYPREYVIRRK